MKRIIIISSLIISLATTTKAQQVAEQPTLQLTGKNTGARVILRWAPGTPGAWQLSNAKGYQLDRMVFSDADDFLEVGYQPLVTEPIKPWPLERWSEIADIDDYAAAAAETLYGERNANAKGATGFSFLDKADEFKNLYATALMTAEFSSRAATALGLRFEDKDIQSDKTYLYRIYSLAGSEEYPIDTAYFLIKGDEITPEPDMHVEVVKEWERAVELRWDRATNEQFFSAYYIERSDDGKNFTRLNETPYLDSPYEGSDISQGWISFTDSVDNYEPHFYRVVGLTTYGELSQPSEMIKAMGRDRTPPDAPFNIKAEQTGTAQMKITWEMADDAKDIAGFMVARGVRTDDQPVNLTPEMLPVSSRIFIDTSYDELTNNWYYVGVVDTAGNANVAFPVHGTVVDSLPPAPPQNLIGSIDTAGVVDLRWDLGKERDLKGYMVFYANQDDHVFANLSNKPIMDTVFRDTVNIKVLTRNIYYKVVAVDAYYNYSDFSEMIELVKPDVIPPVAPVFTDYKVSKEGISLTWAQSTSHDVVLHRLYRREKGTSEWLAIATFDSLKTYQSYLDDSLTRNVTYEYSIKAEDESGLLSDISYTLTLSAIDFTRKPKVAQINASIDPETKAIQLTWAYPVEGDYYFRLYRAVDGGNFNMVQQLEKDTRQFIDTRTSVSRQYEYAIKAVYKDGKDSGFGEVELVRVE
ncbi:MAG: fibronectin type III domain-containing protein [Bacteroidota bacterium]